MDSIIFYRTPDLLNTLVIDPDTLHDGDTPEMERFAKCAAASTEAGFQGYYFDQLPCANGKWLRSWSFDLENPAGCILHELFNLTMNGIMSPKPEEVVKRIREASC